MLNFYTGLGLGLSFQPGSVILIYYFDKRLGRANGIAQTGVAAGIFAIPPLLQIFIDTFGWRGALLLLGGIVANIGVCAGLFRPTSIEYKNRTSGKIQDGSKTKMIEPVREETELNQGQRELEFENRTFAKNEEKSVIETTEQELNQGIKSEPTVNQISEPQPNKYKCHGTKAVMYAIFESFDLKLLTKVNFCLLVAAYSCHSFGYVIIILYLPGRAENVGIPPLEASFLVSIFGIGSFISRLTHGYVIDYHILSVSKLTMLVYAICAASSALYPVSDNYISLATLSFLNGFTSGVYNSTIPIMTKEYVGIERLSGGLGLVLLAIGVFTILGSYATGKFFFFFFLFIPNQFLCRLP